MAEPEPTGVHRNGCTGCEHDPDTFPGCWTDDQVAEEYARVRQLVIGETTKESELRRQRELLAWLLAEARWERDQALRELDRANTAWREIVGQWERGHQDDVLPYTAQLEGEIAALKAEAAESPHPVTEYGQQMSGGGFHVRVNDPAVDRVYPLSAWIEHRVREGNCWRRRVVVVEDWVEVSDV